MKIDADFDWNINQNKIKIQRMVNNGVWTLFLSQDKVDISACPGCNGCAGGGDCTNLAYDFDPPTNSLVTNWQSYTFGIKLATGAANSDGQAKLWVNGVLEDTHTGQKYTTSTGLLRSAWGGWFSRSHPQSPEGFIWYDDQVTTSDSAECTPRGAAVGGGGPPAPVFISVQ